MTSERTRLSGAAVDLVSAVALQMGGQFEPLLPLFFPTLLNLCSRTNKVTITRTRTCILAIIEATQLPSILPYFLQSVKDKSASLRLTSVEGTLCCLNCFNPPDLEREARAKDIEGIIRSSARDANADVRKVSRKVFEAYKLLLPGRVDNFTAPLTPTVRKYLDIKSKPGSGKSSRPASALDSLLSSTSSQQTSTSMSNRPPKDAPHRISHTRSVSSSVQSSTTAKPKLQTKIQAITSEPAVRNGMGPPDYIPVRMTQPSTAAPLSRSTSAIDERKRVVSSVSNSSKPTGVVMASRSVGQSIAIIPARSQPARPVPAPVPTAAASTATGGPRRIPIEVVPPKDAQKPKEIRPNPPKVVSKQPSISALKAGTLGPSSISVKASKNIDKPNVGPKVGAPKNPKNPPVTKTEPTARSQDITRPTASQLARSKPPTGVQQREIVAPKPTWGRPPPRKVKPQPTIKQAPLSKSTATQRRPITPSAIPLPASPTLSVHEIAAPSPDNRPLAPPDGRIVDVNTFQETDSVVEALDTETLEIVGGSVLIEGVDAVVGDPGFSAEDTNTVADAPDPSNMETNPTTGVLDPSLPVVEVTPAIFTDAGDDSSAPMVDINSSAKTPISALLSSIQRGFLFTPSSPMSPPDTYLSRAPPDSMPFSLNTRLFGDSTQA
ncbi:clasp N terminal-domain-containing protein [Infundibulicybe gibba]|nr:clasp N terminal-domain-containing protein [Infundibulicybe gibba]